MIHSLSGGVIHENGYYDFAKVRFEEGEASGKAIWLICPFPTAKEGDRVRAPFGTEILRGMIEKIDRNVNEQTAPLPIKRMKQIEELLHAL